MFNWLLRPEVEWNITKTKLDGEIRTIVMEFQLRSGETFQKTFKDRIFQRDIIVPKFITYRDIGKRYYFNYNRVCEYETFFDDFTASREYRFIDFGDRYILKAEIVEFRPISRELTPTEVFDFKYEVVKKREL